MIRIFFAIAFFCFSISAYSQNKKDNKVSFSDTVEKYFDYDRLSQISCIDVPPGIYSFSFRIDTLNNPYDFNSSTDSLEILNALFKNAIRVALRRVTFERSNKKYLLLAYFNTLLRCNSSNDTTALSENLYAEITKILRYQLSTIETSIGKLISTGDDYYIFPTVCIDDNNLSNKIKRKGFRNDARQRTATPEEIESFEKKIKGKK